MSNMVCTCKGRTFFNKVKEGVVTAVCNNCGTEWEENKE